MGYIKPAERERLIAAYDDRAADCYAKVVTRYPMAPHVEDARDRLVAIGRPVPEPTQTALAESEAEEQSRANIKLKDRAILLVKHGPSTLEAAHVGEPLDDPAKTVTAPEVSKENIAIFNTAAGIKPEAGAARLTGSRQWHRRAAYRRCSRAESRAVLRGNRPWRGDSESERQRRGQQQWRVHHRRNTASRCTLD